MAKGKSEEVTEKNREQFLLGSGKGKQGNKRGADTYLVEGGVDIDKAQGVDTESEDVNGNQGRQGLCNLELDLGHGHQSREVSGLEQQDCDQHLQPEQSPGKRFRIQGPLLDPIERGERRKRGRR